MLLDGGFQRAGEVGGRWEAAAKGRRRRWRGRREAAAGERREDGRRLRGDAAGGRGEK